jgi:hypothetical protein
MMMICNEDVGNYERLRSSSTEVYLTLLDAKVREIEAATPKKKQPDIFKRK